MLSSTAEYALRIMITLAESEMGSMTSTRIAEATRVPPDYAFKVLQLLSSAGLIRGHRGRGGGYRLECDPSRTSLLDVVNAVDPIRRITECPLEREDHRLELCPLHRCLDEALGLLQDRLAGMTIRAVSEQAGSGLCRPPGSATPGC